MSLCYVLRGPARLYTSRTCGTQYTGLRDFQTSNPQALELRDELPRREGRGHLMTFRVTIVGRLWCQFQITALARQRRRCLAMPRLQTCLPASSSCRPRKSGTGGDSYDSRAAFSSCSAKMIVVDFRNATAEGRLGIHVRRHVGKEE
jgi:hypothetical protein